jgi:hypothetical protein
MQNLPDLHEAEASRTSFTASFAADSNTLAFGYNNQNDDAKIADLLQSGACKSKAALARKLEVGAFKLRPALQRVLDTRVPKQLRSTSPWLQTRSRRCARQKAEAKQKSK